ncbi:MAG: hypothetical protein U1F49_16130 [Rubrivivax sp.]
MGAGSLAIAPTAVGTGGLGRYTVTVNRSAIPTPGGYFPSVRFTLSSGRTLTVQITQPAASVARGNWARCTCCSSTRPSSSTSSTPCSRRPPTAAGYRARAATRRAACRSPAGGDTDNDDLDLRPRRNLRRLPGAAGRRQLHRRRVLDRQPQRPQLPGRAAAVGDVAG